MLQIVLFRPRALRMYIYLLDTFASLTMCELQEFEKNLDNFEVILYSSFTHLFQPWCVSELKHALHALHARPIKTSRCSDDGVR